jgi:hypothetical protein
MGYFSNGCEGMDYEEQYCSRCVHQATDNGGCAVFLAHLLHNYDECNNDKSILHLLIPRSKDKLGNEQCAMFYEDTSKPHPDQLDLEDAIAKAQPVEVANG